MLFLWIFGDNVEDRFGSFAAVTHAIMTSHPELPCVGASGAISGVMGSYLVLFPQATVRTRIGYRIVPVPAFVFLGTWLLMQLFFSMFESSIAYFAHIGGFGIGALLAFAYKALKKPDDV